MPSLPYSLLNYLHAVTVAWRDDPRDDAELLARFAESGDEAAFKVLVGRHGPLVWRSCTRILGDTPDAEDAFQTAFLALARKAGRLRREPLAGWLHRVARQAAMDVRSKSLRSQDLERQLRTLSKPELEDNPDRTELYAALDEELVGLPERLRIPLVLRYLEGKTLENIARIVGCSRRDLGRRLARGEALLRERLMRRGLAVGVGSIAVLLGGAVSAPAVPARLVERTARAAVAFRSGTLTNGAAEAARAVLRSLPLERAMIRKSLSIVLACVCSLGAGLAAWQASSARSDVVESPERSESLQADAERSGGRLDRDGDPLPPGALARLGTLRLRHTGSYCLGGAESAVFSQDGKVLITAGGTNPIRLWDATTGKLLHSFDERCPNKVSIALSPDGNTLAAVNEKLSVSLWEVATGKLLRQLEGGPSTLTLAFARDGRTILSVGSVSNPQRGLQNRYRVWEVATGKQLRDQLLSGDPSDFLFSPDGRIMVSFSLRNDNVVTLWEAATGKEIRHLTMENVRFCGDRPPGGAAFSPDNRFLVVSNFFIDGGNAVHRYDGAVHLLDVSTGKEVRKWIPDKMGTCSVAFSPDGKMLATGSAFGPIRLWETATGKELRRCQGYRAHVVALAFSPDGRTLASLAGQSDHTARLWEVASGKERTRTSGGHVGPVLSLAFSSDGKSLISGNRDGLVGFWDAETGQQQHLFLRAGDFQALAALSPDGKTVLSVGNSFSPKGQNRAEVVLRTSTQVCVWDRVSGQKLRQFQGPEGAPQSLTLSPDGKTLVLSFIGSAYLMEVATGKIIRQFTDRRGHSHCAAYSPDGKTLAVAMNDVVHFHATATGKDIGDIRSSGHVWCLAFSPNGQILAFGQEAELITSWIDLWQVREDKKNWKRAGKLVRDKELVPWIDLWQVRQTIPEDAAVRNNWRKWLGAEKFDKNKIWALTFSPDGKTLASAGQDGTVRLWEVATGQQRGCFAGHSGEVWCVAFAPDGRRLATGGNDTTILVWDVTERLHNGQLRPAKLSAQEVKSLWDDLASADAARAGRAIWSLAAAPAQALSLFQKHLRPAIPTGPRIARLIADLDNDDFAVRQRATAELAKARLVAEPVLRRALAKPSSLEKRRRLEQLLEPLEKEERFLLSGEELRSLRALEVLGKTGTSEALRLLEALAGGAPEARQTLEARALLKRLRTQVKATQP